MQTRYETILIIIVGLLIIPQVTFAAWWNPFSWFLKTNDAPKVLRVKISTTTPATNSVTEKPIIKISLSTTTPKLISKRPDIVSPTKLTNAEIIEKVKPAVVYIETDNLAGSGMIVSSDGYIITNAHVVSGFSVASVTLATGDSYKASVVGRDENMDIALLKISAVNLPVVIFENSDLVEQGDNVFSLGFPFGIKGDVSFTAGVISRRLTYKSGAYFQTTAEIHLGNSGGPLVNSYGKVIGINTATYGNVVGNTQIGETIKLAIPINTAKILIPKLKSGNNIIKSSNKEGSAGVEYSCPVVIAETKKVVGTYLQLYTEYKNISEFITTSEKGPDGLTGLDLLKKIYENLSNQCYTLSDKVQQMQDDSIAASNLNLQYGDSGYLLQLGKLFDNASVILKKYFDARLDTLSWVIGNQSWDDYLIEQVKKMDASDYSIIKTAYDSFSQTAIPYTNLMGGYQKILTENKCEGAVTDNGTLLIGMFSETSCKSLLGELATYKNREYTCACGFGAKIYGGRCELYTTICSLQLAYADQQGGCHCYPGSTLEGGTCVKK